MAFHDKAAGRFWSLPRMPRRCFATFREYCPLEMIIFVAGTLLLLALICWSTFRSAVYLRAIPSSFNLRLLPAENAVRLFLIAVCIWLAQTSEQPYIRFGWSLAEPVRDLFLGCAIGIPVALILPNLTQFAIARFGLHIYSPIVIRSILPRNPGEGLLVPLALVGAVLLEELLFRALLLGGFAFFAPPLVLAVLWSILFGVVHLPQGLLGIVVAALLGLLLSVLFLATASLLAPFVAHYTINLVQIFRASRDKSWLKSYGEGTSQRS